MDTYLNPFTKERHMTKDQVAKLAEGKDDVELHTVGRKYGLLNLACDFDGVDPTAESHKSDQFTRANPFVHLAIREGHVQAVVRDVSNNKKVKCRTTGEDMPVYTSSNLEGEELPIHETLFKGETV